MTYKIFLKRTFNGCEIVNIQCKAKKKKVAKAKLDKNMAFAYLFEVFLQSFVPPFWVQFLQWAPSILIENK